MHVLYATINTVNQKFYIGVHDLDAQDKNYKGSGTVISHAFNKYGKDKFDWLILKEFETAEEAYKEEARVVDQTFIGREDTYNVSHGGMGGVGKTNKGKHLTDDHRRNISKATKGRSKPNLKGHHPTEETRRKLGEARKGNQYAKGYHHTEVARQIISEAARGQWVTRKTCNR